MKFDVSLHFWIERPCRSWEECTIRRRIFSFDALASNFLGRVLFLDESLGGVGSWTRHPFLLNLCCTERCKLPLSCSECANIGLPVLLLEWLIEVLGCILIWTRISVTTEQEIFTVCDEACSVGSSFGFTFERCAVGIIWARSEIRVLNINEIPIVNLSISCPKELQEILLLVRFEIAHFVNILVGTRLDFAGHVLFP